MFMNQTVIKIAGNSSTVLFGLTALFQLLLAIGIMPVTMAWGGRQPELTIGLRLASLASIVVLVLFAYILRRRAGLLGNDHSAPWIKKLSWLITGFLCLNTLGNITSLSSLERMVFTPISFLLVVACLIVSLSKVPTPKATI